MNGQAMTQKMESGKTGVFLLSNVQRLEDPDDMYTADAALVGYEQDFPGTISADKDTQSIPAKKGLRPS